MICALHMNKLRVTCFTKSPPPLLPPPLHCLLLCVTSCRCHCHTYLSSVAPQLKTIPRFKGGINTTRPQMGLRSKDSPETGTGKETETFNGTATERWYDPDSCNKTASPPPLVIVLLVITLRITIIAWQSWQDTTRDMHATWHGQWRWEEEEWNKKQSSLRLTMRTSYESSHTITMTLSQINGPAPQCLSVAGWWTMPSSI